MSAHVAGRELDALVAEKVMGWRWLRWMGETSRLMAHGDLGRFLSIGNIAGVEGADYEAADLSEPLHKYATYLVPPYSTDIAAAWQICEMAERERCFVSLSIDPDGVWWARVGAAASQSAPTAPLALCRAALAYADLCAGLPPLWSEAP